MPYAMRNANGQIIALFAEASADATELVDVNLPEVAEFLSLTKGAPSSPEIIEHLSASDISMVRVLEDLLEVLIAKKVILFTDLPTAAQKKLLERRSARSKLTINGDNGLIANDTDAILI
jgi:hypothetical protein